MQQMWMNNIHTKIPLIKSTIIQFANQIESCNRDFRKTVAELEKSFVDSKKYWENTIAKQIELISIESDALYKKIDDIMSELSLLEIQLGQADKSFTRPGNSFTKIVIPKKNNQTVHTHLSQLEALLKQARQIASKCSLNKKTQSFLSFPKGVSNKKKLMYEQLDRLIEEAKDINDQAYYSIENNLLEKKEQLGSMEALEIDKAAKETADLLILLEQQHKDTISSIRNVLVNTLEEIISKKQIKLLQNLSESIYNKEILPSVFSEFLQIGSYCISLSDVEISPDMLDFLIYYFSGTIEDQTLCLPAIIDLRNRANFMFFDIGESVQAKEAINSLIFTLLSNEPALYQKFILFDPEGHSQSFAPFLEFMRINPNVICNKVFTTQKQIKDQIEELSNFIDEFNQTKLADNTDIFQYNSISVDRPESLKCLCLLNFPKGFDEQTLDNLYNIVKNGGVCGIVAIIQFDESEILNQNYSNYLELLSKIRECCVCLNLYENGWSSDNSNTIWKFYDVPNKKVLSDFSDLYKLKFTEITNSTLPFAKIKPEETWFKENSSKQFSVPIGKNENGDIQYLEFGDPVAQGTSHHALVTGSLGSGKSTLLHTIIMSAISTYNPDEVNLYLLDFKSGTEFQVYANYKIPHIKVIALDAMQEFGQSVLDELVNMMQKRLNLFTEEAKKGYPVKDISSYRHYTGKKMPRILVVADEFQLMFSESHNRRVANICAARLADIISLYRVCGIHFVLATQTLARLRNGFTVSPSTLSEMHVRIGLRCSESECSLLFGDANTKTAFGKMGEIKGTAVYSDNYVNGKPISFKVAYCNADTQIEMLKKIEFRYGLVEAAEKTKVFVGESIPKLSECLEYRNINMDETSNNVPIYLGEPIRFDNPVTININRRKRNTLLIVGSAQQMIDQIIAVYISNAIKSKQCNLVASEEKSVYLFDGLAMMGENLSEKIGYIVNSNKLDINVVEDEFEVLPIIDKLYSIYEQRKHQKKRGGEVSGQYIHVIINNFQWIEPIVQILNNKSVDDFILSNKETESNDDRGEVFSFVNQKQNENDITDKLNFLNEELTLFKTNSTSDVSYHKKLMTLIESGYSYGFNVVLSCPDYISIKDIIYECIPKFQNRILFAISDKDADRIVSEARVESLRSNIVVFHDGINSAYQFKPYDIN